MRPPSATSSSGCDAERRRHLREQLRRARFTDVTRIAGVDRRRRRAAARPAAERIDRVADLRLHRADRQAERFGRHHRDDRPRAGAEVLRAAFDDDAAVAT